MNTRNQPEGSFSTNFDDYHQDVFALQALIYRRQHIGYRTWHLPHAFMHIIDHANEGIAQVDMFTRKLDQQGRFKPGQNRIERTDFYLDRAETSTTTHEKFLKDPNTLRTVANFVIVRTQILQGDTTMYAERDYSTGLAIPVVRTIDTLPALVGQSSEVATHPSMAAVAQSELAKAA